jgi:hypothetical protein
MLRGRLLILASFLLIGSVLTLSQVSGEIPKNCSVQDSAQFPALHGKGGDGKDYDFRYTAAVSITATNSVKVYRYQHVIKNDSPTLVLDVQWEKGNLLFQEVYPNGCASNPYESLASAKEDQDAPILYGEAKQFRTKASAYFQTRDPRGHAYRNSPPCSRSRPEPTNCNTRCRLSIGL